MRIIEVLHKEIFEGLKEKDKHVQHGRKLSAKIDELEEERNKVGLQVQKIKDRIIPLIEEEMKRQPLSEYEAVGEVRASKKNNTIEIEVFDQVEACREFLDDKKKEEALRKEANESDAAPEQLQEPAPDAPAGN